MVDQYEAERMKWRSIETAPKDGSEILLFAKFDIGLCYWRDDKVMTGWTWGLGEEFNSPTHWMPLPERPAIDAAMLAAHKKEEGE